MKIRAYATNKIEQFFGDIFDPAGFKKYTLNTGWQFFARIAGMAISFFVVAYVARYLGPENYGTLSYAISFVSLFSFLASLGIDQVLYRDLVRYPERKKEYLGTAFVLQSIGGILAAALSISIAYLTGNDQIGLILITILSLGYLFRGYVVFGIAYQAEVKAKYPSLISIAVIVVLSMLKIAVVIFDKGIIFFSLVYALEPALYLLFFLLVSRPYFGSLLSWQFNIKLITSILRESLPLMLSTMFIVIYSRIDQVMIKAFIDSTAVGIYDAAVRIAELWYFFPSVIISSLFPAIINAKKTNRELYINRIKSLAILLIVFAIGISLIITILSKPLLLLVFGNAFVDGSAVLQLYVWGGIGYASTLLLNQIIITEAKTNLILLISVIGVILNVTLNFFFIPRYGINGAALATLISYTLTPISLFLIPNVRSNAYIFDK